MDFKGYSELFHAAINRRNNRIPATRPTAPTKFATHNPTDDYALAAKFAWVYRNKLSKREQKAETPLRLYRAISSIDERTIDTFNFNSDSLRQELKDFIAKYDK